MNNEFEQYLQEQDRSQNTIDAYSQDMRGFSSWFFDTNQEELSPTSLTPQDIKQYKYFLLLEKKAAPATINRKIISIKTYCKWANKSGIIDYDPTIDIKQIKEQQLSPKWLDKKTQFAILRTVDRNILASKTRLQKQNAIRNKSIIVVLLNTGLRIAELCDLKISDLLITDHKGLITVRHGKGLKARVVPLNQVARYSLIEWLAIRPDIYDDFLFTGKGRGLQVRGVQEVIEEISIECKLPFTSRQLRSSFAKNLLDSKVTIETISVLMGHKNIQITCERYLIPDQQRLQVSVDTLVDC